MAAYCDTLARGRERQIGRFFLTAARRYVIYAGLRTQARSSVEEHYLDTVVVGGSIPPVPTVLSYPMSSRVCLSPPTSRLVSFDRPSSARDDSRRQRNRVLCGR